LKQFSQLIWAFWTNCKLRVIKKRVQLFLVDFGKWGWISVLGFQKSKEFWYLWFRWASKCSDSVVGVSCRLVVGSLTMVGIDGWQFEDLGRKVLVTGIHRWERWEEAEVTEKDYMRRRCHTELTGSKCSDDGGGWSSSPEAMVLTKPLLRREGGEKE